MKKNLFFSLILTLLFINGSVCAQEQQVKLNTSIGPALSIKAPQLSVVNLNNKVTTIKEISGDKGLVILFFRSADWCPFCKRHLLELNDIAKKFTDLGYGLSGISYDSTDILRTFSQQHNIQFTLLSDQHAKTMKAFRILNKDYAVGDANYGIPYPGVVVIDKEGKVTHKHFFKGYKKRVKFENLYQQLSMNK